MSIRRATAIPLMRRAFAKGQSSASFLRELRAKGLTYRKTTMLADWRNVANIKEREELFKYVRKDRKPTQRIIAEVDWKISDEFMYVCKVKSRKAPDEPITERDINVMQDRVLTPAEVEALAWEMIGEQSPKKIAEVVSITPWTVIQRVL